MFNPLNQPEWPKLPPEYHDKYPFGLLVFMIGLPGQIDAHRQEAVHIITEALSIYHRKLGGMGLEIVVPLYNNDGRYEWIVSPILSPHWTQEEEAKRMALVARKLRLEENRMSLGGA